MFSETRDRNEGSVQKDTKVLTGLEEYTNLKELVRSSCDK